MISLMPEAAAALLFTGSSPPPRLWFCQVQQPSATPGESSAGQRRPLCGALVGRQATSSARIIFRAYLSGLIFKHCKNICANKGTLVSLKFATTYLSTWATFGVGTR